MDISLSKYTKQTQNSYEEDLKLSGNSIKLLNIGGNAASIKVTFTNFTYVIKILQSDDDEELENEIYFNEIFLENFKSHPHIIKPYKIEKLSKIPYIFKCDEYQDFMERDSEKVESIYMEYANYGNLEDYIQNVKESELYIIIFQLIYTLMKINQVIPGYCFGDLGLGNVFVSKDENYEEGLSKKYLYILNDKNYSIPVLPYIIKIGDFGSNSEGCNKIEQFEDIRDFCSNLKENLENIKDKKLKNLFNTIKHRIVVTINELLEEGEFGKLFFNDNINIDEFVSIFGI